MKFLFFNLRSNWVDRSGIPDFLVADCRLVCFERTTQVNVRIVEEESLVYRPVSHVVLGYLNGMPWAGTGRCAWPKFMEILSLGLVGLYPVPKWNPVSAMLKKHLGSLKKSDWSQDCRATFMDSEGFGICMSWRLFFHGFIAFWSVSPSRRDRIWHGSTHVFSAIRTSSALRHKCNVADPLVSLSRFGSHRGDVLSSRWTSIIPGCRKWAGSTWRPVVDLRHFQLIRVNCITTNFGDFGLETNWYLNWGSFGVTGLTSKRC